MNAPTSPRDPITASLWQGSRPEKGGELAREGFHAVVLADDEYQPGAKYFPGVRVLHCPLLDQLDQRPEDIARMILVSKEVSRLIQSGAKVLSTCRMGLNRSGVISALALCDLGHDPAKAIAAVRRARGPYGLSNKTFERIVLSYPKVKHGIP